MGWNILTVVDSTDGSIGGGTEITEWTSNRVGITHGRQSLADDAKPSTGSFEFLWNATGAPTADSFNIGRRIQIWLQIDSYPTAPQCLYDGSITDVTVRNDTLNVIAVNRALAEAGRQTIASNSVIEDTVANALTSVYNLGPQDNRLGNMQGSKQVRVSTFSAENLLGLMREIADSEIGGYVTNSMPWGPTVYGNITGPVVLNRTVANRSQLTPDLTFTGDELLDEWRFERHQDQLVNRVAVYGTDDATDFPDGVVTEDFQTSIDNYGLNELTIVTRLRYEADAELLAADKIDRYYVNGWIIERLQLLLGNMTDARLYTVLTNLNPDTYIETPAIFTGAPTRFFVEGMRFTVSKHDLQASLFVSTAGYSRGAQQWQQVSPSRTWGTVPSTLTWTGSRLVEL
jgi:hypothetical protein